MSVPKTRVVNLKTERYDVYIGRGRGSIFGNPFILGRDGDRTEVIGSFKRYFYNRLTLDDGFKAKVLELKGKVLGCFCKPLPCHGDVIVEYLEGL